MKDRNKMTLFKSWVMPKSGENKATICDDDKLVSVSVWDWT